MWWHFWALYAVRPCGARPQEQSADLELHDALSAVENSSLKWISDDLESGCRSGFEIVGLKKIYRKLGAEMSKGGRRDSPFRWRGRREEDGGFAAIESRVRWLRRSCKDPGSSALGVRFGSPLSLSLSLSCKGKKQINLENFGASLEQNDPKFIIAGLTDHIGLINNVYKNRRERERAESDRIRKW